MDIWKIVNSVQNHTAILMHSELPALFEVLLHSTQRCILIIFCSLRKFFNIFQKYEGMKNCEFCSKDIAILMHSILPGLFEVLLHSIRRYILIKFCPIETKYNKIHVKIDNNMSHNICSSSVFLDIGLSRTRYTLTSISMFLK